MRLKFVAPFLLWPMLAAAQTTLYWAGAGQNPAVGGSGGWNTFNANWSTVSGTYAAATWANGAAHHAVFGGSTGGTVTLDSGGISGVQLTLQQDYTLDTLGNTATFAGLDFSGAATNLIVTGGGTLSTKLTGGTVTLSNVTFALQDASAGTLVAKDGAVIAGLASANSTGTVAVRFHDTATLQTRGRNHTLESISSATVGAGVIENGHGIRASILTVNQPAGTETFSGVIRDNAVGPQSFAKLRLTKDGAGTLVLDGVQKTYTDGTVVAGGTLRLAAANLLPAGGNVMVGLSVSGALDLGGYDQSIGALNGTLAGSTVNLGTAVLTMMGLPLTNGGGNFSGVVSGAGQLVKVGTGIQSLGGANTYSGGTTVEGGTLFAGHATAFGAGPVTFKAGTTIGLATNLLAKDITFESGEVMVVPGAGGNRTLSGVLSGGAMLNFTTLGSTYILTGVNTYNGGTKVTDATLLIGSDAALGDAAGGIVLDGAKLQWSQAFNLGAARSISLVGGGMLSTVGTVTVSQNIGGTGSLALNPNGGTVILTGVNSFEGLYVDSGTVSVNADAALGATNNTVSIGTAGTLRFTASTAIAATRSLQISSSSTNKISVDAGATVMVPTAITKESIFPASLYKTGLGTLVLTAPPTIGGSIQVGQGTLRLSAGNEALPANQVIGVEGVMDFDGYDQTVTRVEGFGTVNPGGGTLTITAGTVFNGGFAGTGTIRHTGTGMFSVTGKDAFAGTFQVEAGSLALWGSLGSGSTLVLWDQSTLYGLGTTGTLQAAAGSKVSPGGPLGWANVVGLLRAGNTRLAGGAHYVWHIQSGVRDRLEINGDLTLAANAGTPVIVDVITLDDFATAAPMSGFDQTQNHRFKLITTTAGVSGFDSDAVTANVAGFQNSYTGVFRVELANAGRDLELAYYSSRFKLWQDDHFTASELLDANISGPNADPDHDGFANLLEYALGLEPKSASTTGLPQAGTAGGDWTYTYTRPADRADVIYAAEVSTDLASWGTSGVTHEFVSASGGIETWRARYPLASATNVFFRLKVTGQ